MWQDTIKSHSVRDRSKNDSFFRGVGAEVEVIIKPVKIQFRGHAQQLCVRYGDRLDRLLDRAIGAVHADRKT